MCLPLGTANLWSRAAKTNWDLQEGLDFTDLTVTAAGRWLYSLGHKGLRQWN